MSFILKALQKLDEENAARQVEPAAMESAILAPVTRPAVASRWARNWLAIALVFLAGGTITYLFMPKTSTPVVPQQEKAIAQATPATPPTAPVAREERQPVTPAPAAGRVPPPATGAAGRSPAHQGSRARNLGDAAPGDAAVAIPSPLPADAVTTQLAVNGIAFQDDPAASAAVVNGVYVKRGMTVGGARVERIFQDKVRFTSAGRTFEVPLAK